MRRARLFFALIAPLALLASPGASCGPRDVQTSEALVGRWQGHVAWHDATTPIALRIAPDGDSLAVHFFAPALGVDSLDAGRLSFDSPRVHFAVPDSIGAIDFDGWLRRGLVVGAFCNPKLLEANPSRLPQLSLRRVEAPRHASAWPESLNAKPALEQAPQRSFGAWLRALVRYGS